MTTRVPIEPGYFTVPDDPAEPPRLLGSRCPSCGEQFFPRRHVCAKFGAEDGCDGAVLQQVGDFMRRGLVAYVGAERARELAERCLEAAARPA